jgi:hypothetical protein
MWVGLEGIEGAAWALSSQAFKRRNWWAGSAMLEPHGVAFSVLLGNGAFL